MGQGDMADKPEVWVTVEVDESVPMVPGERSGHADTGGGYGPAGIAKAVKRITSQKRVPLDADLLQKQMMGLLAVVGDLFDQASQQPQMKREELELAVAIDGEGQVSLVGNGAKLGSSGGITMKFTAK
jgi:hypothetical protein